MYSAYYSDLIKLHIILQDNNIILQDNNNE